MMVRAWAVFVCCAFALVAVPAAAQEPTATPSAVATPTEAAMVLREEGVGQYSWDPVPGAASYRLRVELGVVRANAADPFCSPPLVSDTRTITVDETLPATQLSYAIALPELPPEDGWFEHGSTVDLRALDGAGTQIAGTRRQGITETVCPRQAIADPLVFAGCTIPVGWFEVTTPAAAERGQRVFESPSGAERWYTSTRPETASTW